MSISNGNISNGTNSSSGSSRRFLVVTVATTANISLVSAPASIDGYSSLVSGISTILVKNQTPDVSGNPNNLIYIWNGTGNALTLSPSGNTWDDYISTFVVVGHGTVNANTNWLSSATAGGVLFTTPISWVQNSGVYTATGAIGLNGNVFSLNTQGLPASNFYNGVNSSGNFIFAQPAFTDISGVATIAQGGTNSATTLTNKQIMVSSAGSIVEAGAMINGQLLIGNTGNAPTVAALTGTSNQIVVTNGAGSITLSLPQSIAVGSTPTFASETLTANTNQMVLGTTNTTTVTMASLTGSRTFTLPDANSNPVRPLGSATANNWVQYIDATGLQNLAQPAFSNLSGNITNAQMTDNTIAYARLVNIAANSILGSIAGGAIGELSAANIRTILGIPTTAVSGNVVSLNGTSGAMQDSGLAANKVVTTSGSTNTGTLPKFQAATNVVVDSLILASTVAIIDQGTTPTIAGNFLMSEISTTNTMVDSGINQSDLGNKYAFISLTSDFNTPSSGNAIPFNTVVTNTTSATFNTTTGVCTLAANKIYKFKCNAHLIYTNSSGGAIYGFTINGNSTLAGGVCNTRPATSAQDEQGGMGCFGYYKTGGSTVTVQVTLTTASNIARVYGTGPTTYWQLEEHPL